ncbi:sensor histidine kinase [Lysobacter sp. GX 14042]|uniref:sensor histidine kinase n=1 Tax=Lysobacter sp. GX 14042 TaxID=2907155 RepID=UPI001F196F96|nr:sensor histidine kinase [Lysobacter sp. GX 14042]MCE7032041.1 sensor histidine kinase [Lysobacter sp. GX 14042]
MDHSRTRATVMLRRWLSPAPDSLLACAARRGSAPWTEWVHLLWTAWVFITPMFTPSGYDTRWIGLTLLSYPLFLVLYGLTLLRPERKMWLPALGMVVLSMLLLRWYPSGLSYFVFGCVMLRGARGHGLVRYLAMLVLLNGALLAMALALGYPWQAVAWLPAVTVIIGLVVHADAVNRHKDAALKLSQEEVRRLATAAERERIGRDLHDLLGHTLSLVALKSDLAARLIERNPDRALAEISEVSRVSREALAQVRAAVTGIRSAGLAAELASARLLLECAGVAMRHEVGYSGVDAAALPVPLETALAMVLREAATNIQRHAGATRAEVTLQVDRDRAVLCISDDGRGGADVPGNGLAGMRERVEVLGGRLRVDSSRRRGTTVEACIPVRAVGPAPAAPAPDRGARRDGSAPASPALAGALRR